MTRDYTYDRVVVDPQMRLRVGVQFEFYFRLSHTD